MTKILAIDLGKFKSVACLFETETNQTEFCTMTTDRHYLETVLRNYTPDLVVVEACAISGWVSDFCQQEGYQVLVCSPSQEAWQWKNVKRKTDKDDALKLAGHRPGGLVGRRWGNWCRFTCPVKSNASIVRRSPTARSSWAGSTR